MENKFDKFKRKLKENKFALISLIISYGFGIFFILYKKETKWVIVINIIQMSLVTLIVTLLMLGVKLPCCCKKKEQVKEQNKPNVIEEGQKLLDSINNEIRKIVNLQELANKGDKIAETLLKNIKDSIKIKKDMLKNKN